MTSKQRVSAGGELGRRGTVRARGWPIRSGKGLGRREGIEGTSPQNSSPLPFSNPTQLFSITRQCPRSAGLTMPATFSSLPPEVVLEILGHLPRPALEAKLPTPSPLVATARVSHQLTAASQKFLFSSVTLEGKEQIDRFASTEARKWTTELWIEVGNGDLAEGGAWLEETMREVMSKRGKVVGKRLKVLVLEGVRGQQIDDDGSRVAERRVSDSLIVCVSVANMTDHLARSIFRLSLTLNHSPDSVDP